MKPPFNRKNKDVKASERLPLHTGESTHHTVTSIQQVKEILRRGPTTESKPNHILLLGGAGVVIEEALATVAQERGSVIRRVDIARMVYKYVDETAQKLHTIFQEAREKNVVLLFEEADVLFGKRTEVKDAHDKYANLQSSFFLQLDQFQGTAILMLKSNIDPAFIRRFHSVVRFEKPA